MKKKSNVQFKISIGVVIFFGVSVHNIDLVVKEEPASKSLLWLHGDQYCHDENSKTFKNGLCIVVNILF